VWLRDIESAPGVHGIQRKTVAFTVGRSQVSLPRRPAPSQVSPPDKLGLNGDSRGEDHLLAV
jgi:hypothetical protein